jgi:hypothetical protein
MDHKNSLGSDGLGPPHAMGLEGEGSDSDGSSFEERMIGAGVSNSGMWAL